MPQSLVFHPLVVVRNPSLPFTLPVSRQQVIEKLKDPFFREALFLASPDLYAATRRRVGQESPEAPALPASLINYLNRMRSRSTPFGLFATCSLVPWAAALPIILGKDCRRHTRLDMHYVCSLAQSLSRLRPIREWLLYYPNTSYFQAGDQIRYVEYRYENGQRIHQHTAVYASEPLQTLLKNAHGGLTPAGLGQLLQAPGRSPEEIQRFVEELIDAQVLVSELEPALTGEEFSDRLLQVLARLQTAHPEPELETVLQALRQVARQLQQLDASPQPLPADYDQISALLPPQDGPLDKKKLFQVDLIRPVQSGGLPASLQQDLLDFIPLFGKLAAVPENPRLADFRQKYRARYEDQARPLLEVLDPDIGIGYGAAPAPGYQPLVEDLVLSAAEKEDPLPTIGRNAAEQWLYRQVRAAEHQGLKVIQLAPQDLAALPDLPAPLPPSLAAIFRLPRPGQVQLEALSGPSAVNLISRFAHSDPGFADLARSVTDREQAHNPGVLFAEIVHLPEKRTGNILLRPHLRPYEIPYLAASALPATRQIRVQDLYVRVQDDQVILFSPVLNQEIIPRLGTAHHYTAESLPVYLFLCDLQGQGVQAEMALNWQPGHYDTHYLPRLTCQHFILGLATWQLDRSALEPLLAADPQNRMQVFRQFQQHWGLPDRFTFGEGDRDLLIEAHHPDTVTAWLHTIRQQTTITLREYLYEPDPGLVADEARHPYEAQFIASLINLLPAYRPAVVPASLPDPAVRQSFPPGSEWLYYKLYGGAQATETVLTEALAPLTQELRQEKLIDQWFFIRYQDPDTHIRLRLHLPAPEKIGEVMTRVYQYLQPYQESGLIWKTQTCTYQRETGRYGPSAIQWAEQLFFADSLAVADYLARGREEAEEDRRWIWGLAAIDQLLTCFHYGLEDKLKIIAGLKDRFGREFKLDKDLQLAMNQKYRYYRSAIRQGFDTWRGDTASPEAPYQAESLALLESVARQLRALAGQDQLEVPLADLVASFIHMHVNRLIPAQARLHELLLYDFLGRHYKSELARQQKQALTSCPR
jgi:lantibiotic biosynthesis protein